MTIYVDQMFLENFIMNFIILYATSKFSGKEWKWYRLSIGAAIGALYVIFSYILGFYNKQFIIGNILLAIIMVITSFKIKNIKEFLKIFIFFVGITFLIGGASFGLAFFANIAMISDGGVLYVEEFPILMIVIGSTVSITIVKWTCILLKNRLNLNNFIYEIKMKMFNKEVSTSILLDSGHSVKERFTGYPVIILEKNIFSDIVPKEILKKVEENNFEFEESWRRRLRLIPISTVSDKNEVLIGFKIDEAIIYMDSDNKHIKNIIVVGCDRKLDKDDKYFGLMGNILD